jgi:hypothetical protein
MDPGLMPNLRRVTRRHGLLAECRLKLTDPSLNCRQQGNALIDEIGHRILLRIQALYPAGQMG